MKMRNLLNFCLVVTWKLFGIQSILKKNTKIKIHEWKFGEVLILNGGLMKMKTNPNDPAFPSHGTMGEVCYEGMTKREIFAAMAMNGLCHDYGRN